MNNKNKDSKFLDVIYKDAEEQKAQLKQDIRNKKKNKNIKPAAAAAENTKESKFFDAINQDAAAHMAEITREIEAYKNDKIEQATEQGLNDAYNLIREDVTRRTAAITNDVAKKELELKNGLFRERQTIRDEVFKEAEERLRRFIATEDYNRFLKDSLAEIAATAGTDPCIVYIASSDEDKRALIDTALPGSEIRVDDHILIGGVKAYCHDKGIMMDDTLDTRLSDQYLWFNDNADLKVV